MKIEIQYCAAWNYTPQAVSLTQKVLDTYLQKISNLTLVPSSGGCFEVSLDGDLAYSKLQTGEFPNENSIVDMIGERL